MSTVSPYAREIRREGLSAGVTADTPPPSDADDQDRRDRRRQSAIRRARRRRRTALGAALGAAALAAVLIISTGGDSSRKPDVPPSPQVSRQAGAHVPPLVDPNDVYAADRPGRLAPAVSHFPSRVYVPNSESDTVSVINPRTYKVIDEFPVGVNPQHVVPSYDLKTLWVNNDQGNSLTPIDPRTGKPGHTVPVTDPYNLYFTPDGRYAIVVEERMQALAFRDAHSMHLHRALHVPCDGVNHMDFSADGRYLVASCEFGGNLVRVDVAHEKVTGTLSLRAGASPQDVRLSPDGRIFYVADLHLNGVWLIDARSFKKIGFVHTGLAAHGIYPSRDSRFLYVTNRGEGSISVISFATREVVHKWRIPGGGSPDMGGVSADGKVFWVSGRYNAVVYAISTVNGRLLARIPVGSGPHGVCVYPLPGRYSLGHTDNMR
jgi:YVTN family beta-propeller protein